MTAVNPQSDQAAEVDLMDEELTRQARAEMVNHDEWVTKAFAKLTPIISAMAVEDVVQGWGTDRTAKMVTFTQNIIANAEKAGREGNWAYETVMVRLCAALYQLGEAQMEIGRLRNALPLEGNRRTGPLGS